MVPWYFASCFSPASCCTSVPPVPDSAGAQNAEQRAGPSDSVSAYGALPQSTALSLQWMDVKVLRQQQSGQGQAGGYKMRRFTGIGPRAAQIPSLPFSIHQRKPLAFQPGIWTSLSAHCSRPRILKFLCIRLTWEAH